MRRTISFLGGLFLSGAVGTAVASFQQPDLGEDVSVPGLAGRLFEPSPERRAGLKRPLIVALHGGGGGGSDNVAQVRPFRELVDSADARGVYLYLPQAPVSWSVADLQQRVFNRIDALMAERDIDPDRVYLTGYSLGGGGTWNLLHAAPHRFAAAVPVCAEHPTLSFTADRIAGVPVWAFHARDDGSMPVEGVRSVVNRLLEAAGLPAVDFRFLSSDDFVVNEESANLRYTELAAGNHEIWPRVYQDEAMLDWLLNQTQGDKVVEPVGPRILEHPGSHTVPPGSAVKLAVEASARAGDLQISWWKDGVELSGESAPELALAPVQAREAGTYRARLRDATGEKWSRPALLQVGAGEEGPLLNLSVRGHLDGGEDSMTAGFVVGGNTPGRMLLRAVGPGLRAYGVTGVLEDPVLVLHWHHGGTSEVFATVDDWSIDEILAGDRQAAAVQVGAFPLEVGSRDAAMIVDLPAGVFTVEARSRNGDGGQVLVEVYELR